MATKTWEPKALAVAQVSTVQVTAFDVTTTYDLVVNGVTVASTIGVTDADGTAAALAAAWEASTHPYTTGVTATSATDTVTLTGTAEIPFTVTSVDTGGAGTIGSVSETTAATGPHTLDEPINWSGEALPVNDDVLVFRDSDSNVAWGLDGLSTTGHLLQVNQSYTGLIGLDWRGVATSADGAVIDPDAVEYRPIYLQLDCARIEIGEHSGIADPGGSQRCMIDNDRGSASQTVIFNTNTTSTENGKPPVRLKAAHADADIDVRSGVVGLAVDVPGETSTFGDVIVAAGQVISGDGVTLTNWTQNGGNNQININVATLTLALVRGGSLVIDGDQAITDLQISGSGRVVSNTTGTITDVTHVNSGGFVDYTKSGETRTITNHQLAPGATFAPNGGVANITNLLEPDGPSTISVA